MINEAPKIIRPQVGPQELFLSTPADIAFYEVLPVEGKHMLCC
jgi:hypothetical protein